MTIYIVLFILFFLSSDDTHHRHYHQDPDHDSSNHRSYHEDEESPNSSESSFKPKAEAKPACLEKSPRHDQHKHNVFSVLEVRQKLLTLWCFHC